ncbi:serine protease [Patescibacteria group bacterium]|nr:serine protease [Patescibacteria group bacterium]MBU2220143.1 serine protease [Patescibacteria group bacterium]MBU2265316.1 serine protease [Patescibacteria group bacterium]
MNKNFFIFLIVVFLAAISLLGGLLYRHQSQVAAELSLVFNEPSDLDIDFSSALNFLKHGTSTKDEIALLKKEIEELKKRPPQTVYKTALIPASSLPAPDLKTQEELEAANQKINSLQQQLQQLQSQSNQSSSPSGDANLIQSWQANEKVAQIACQDKYLGGWQLGSGVLISSDGKILTNQHVVQLSSGLVPDYCLVLFSKDYDADSQGFRREYRATVAGYFSGRDAALLKVQDVIYQDDSGQIQTAPILNHFQFFQPASGQAQVGDTIYIFGFPESAKFNFSATKGIISNLIPNDVYFGTDAQIDRGNSGGAAVNAAGQLIGLPTYKYAGGGDYRGYILDIHSLNLN